MDTALVLVIIEGVLLIGAIIGLLIRGTVQYSRITSNIEGLEKRETKRESVIETSLKTQQEMLVTVTQLQGGLVALAKDHGDSTIWLREIATDLKELNGQFREFLGGQKNVHPI